jgi:Amt family ammonium transporter
MGAFLLRPARRAATISLIAFLSFATPAFAATSAINPADTAWMIIATALVLMMTIPGLALFYSGMVRKKNVLATMAQSLAAVMIISILWAAFGYSLVFTGDGPWLGALDRLLLAGMGMDSVHPSAKTIPEALLVYPGLCAARALDLGRRIPSLVGCGRFRRWPCRASLRWRERSGRRQSDGSAPGLWL